MMDADVEPEPCRRCGTPITPGFGWCPDCDEIEKLRAENERLRAFARDARALAYSGDCDACGATDELMDLGDKHGINGP